MKIVLPLTLSLLCSFAQTVQALNNQINFIHPKHQYPTNAQSQIHRMPSHKTESTLPSHLTNVLGGGYGGNERTGKLIYDNGWYNLHALTVSRDDLTQTCYLENENTAVYYQNIGPNPTGRGPMVSYSCKEIDSAHNNKYWNGEFNTTNGGYSPDNDALYAGQEITNMFLAWFGTYPLKNPDGSHMRINLLTHYPAATAGTVDNDIVLGDGGRDRVYNDEHYPYTSPGLIAFMVAMLFTEQNSNLNPYGAQSGALYYSFAAMAAQAIQYYLHGEVNWEVGSEISKTKKALYYFVKPSRDCEYTGMFYDCSIDHLSQYKKNLDPVFASGLFRRAYYLLATTPNWNVQKVFTVLVRANQKYWTPDSDFKQGMCGIVQAAKDYHYDVWSVRLAFGDVGLNTADCKN